MSNRATRAHSAESSDRNCRPYVVMMYMSLIVFVIALTVGADYLWALVALSSLVLYLATYFWLVRPIARQVANRKTSNLDDRRITIRDRAYYIAYQILSIVLVIVLTCALMAVTFGDPLLSALRDGRLLTALIVFFANLIATLPASAIIWTGLHLAHNEEN